MAKTILYKWGLMLLNFSLCPIDLCVICQEVASLTPLRYPPQGVLIQSLNRSKSPVVIGDKRRGQAIDHWKLPILVHKGESLIYIYIYTAESIM